MFSPNINFPALGYYDHALSATGMEPRFGLGLAPSDFFHGQSLLPRPSSLHHLPTGYNRPFSLARRLVDDLDKDRKALHFGKDGFQACVDVHHFQPSEITVKSVDNYVIIEGKHEERDDGHGSVQRHFIRKYSLPKDYDMNSLHTSLSSDGILMIKAPPPAALTGGEKHHQIQHTNAPAHLSVKHDKKEEEKSKNGK